MASVDNIFSLQTAIANADEGNKSSMKDLHSQLIALLAVKAQAMDTLISLQQSYNQHVEVGDAAGVYDLGNFCKLNESYKKAIKEH